MELYSQPMATGSRNKLALEAMHRAMEIRREAGIKTLAPICIYDLAKDLGVRVMFDDTLPSMEGMYRKGKRPLIILSSLRPAGRIVFNCAHELGHYAFKHGSRIDELLEHPSDNPEEYLVDCFAGALLMPKSTVQQAFLNRNWDLKACTPIQAFIIAGWFGVGYTTLIQHMANMLNIMPRTYATGLMKVQPKQIRASILGFELEEDLFVADQYWTDRAIDIQVGDVIHLPSGIINEKIGSNHCVKRIAETSNATLLKGDTPGIGQIRHPETGWTAFVRVSPHKFKGWSGNRHLEVTDDE